MEPKVSFIVPCYNLAHLLPECVQSILSQTCDDFEILVMDDCSPDDTPEVVGSYADTRIVHVRNVENLGHLANYNKGIEMARGDYVWLISADDRLRRPYILEKFLKLLEERPSVGYVFCPAFGLGSDRETNVLNYTTCGDVDRVFPGREFFTRLLEHNCVAAASAMARKDCYRQISKFPLDLPYAGDWFLWAAFALHHDVAYFAEPMVNYRTHQQSMTNAFIKKDLEIIVKDELRVYKYLRQQAAELSAWPVVTDCDTFLVKKYVDHVFYHHKETADAYPVEEMLNDYGDSRRLRKRLAAAIFAKLADQYYGCGEWSEAKRQYRKALRRDWRMLEVWSKYLLITCGKGGGNFRKMLAQARNRCGRV